MQRLYMYCDGQEWRILSLFSYISDESRCENALLQVILIGFVNRNYWVSHTAKHMDQRLNKSEKIKFWKEKLVTFEE